MIMMPKPTEREKKICPKAAPQTEAEATLVVKETLAAQREALSGVSLDEEAVNLMKQQRAYQGAARLISAVNDLMDEMMALVR